MNFLGFIGMFTMERQVEPSPGFIVRPIAAVFGYVIDFLFNIVYAIGPAHSLGITIILMTIIFRALMMPLSIKSQKSMMRMRELKPELDKIEAKYGKSKDPEIVKKMNAEKTALIAKNDANPLKSCFPMLLQMPLFIGLNFIMRQAFLYVSTLRNVYHELAIAIQQVPGYLDIIGPMARPLIPDSILQNNVEAHRLVQYGGQTLEQAREQLGDVISLDVAADLSRVIHLFSAENWAYIQESIPAYYWTAINELNMHRQSIEHFLGLNLVDSSSLSWPTIMVPLLVGVTMLCSSWLMQQRTADPNADEKAKLQQRIMLVVMPVFIAAITFGMPVGVGLFWITSQIYQIAQDIGLNIKDGVPIRLPFMKKAE